MKKVKFNIGKKLSLSEFNSLKDKIKAIDKNIQGISICAVKENYLIVTYKVN